ncbi:MAG: aroH [Thermoleophilia bacterium]|nr:aroH [Thermoleophilia bacterium]
MRGATVASANTSEAIRESVTELVQALVDANGIDSGDVASAFFTTTPDLDAAFPAEGVRHMGWEYVPLLGAVEMAKPGSLTHVIRVLLHWNTELGPREIQHKYLRGTDVLRTPGPGDTPQ